MRIERSLTLASTLDCKRAEIRRLLEEAGYIDEDGVPPANDAFKLYAVSRDPLWPRALYDAGRTFGHMKEQRALRGARIDVVGEASRPEPWLRVRLQPSLIAWSFIIGAVVLAMSIWVMVEIMRTSESVSRGEGNWFEFRPGACAVIPALLGSAVLASWLKGTAREIGQMRKTVDLLKSRAW